MVVYIVGKRSGVESKLKGRRKRMGKLLLKHRHYLWQRLVDVNYIIDSDFDQL